MPHEQHREVKSKLRLRRVKRRLRVLLLVVHSRSTAVPLQARTPRNWLISHSRTMHGFCGEPGCRRCPALVLHGSPTGPVLAVGRHSRQVSSSSESVWIPGARIGNGVCRSRSYFSVATNSAERGYSVRRGLVALVACGGRCADCQRRKISAFDFLTVDR